MSVSSAIMRAFHKKWAGGWKTHPQMFWAIDLHGVILRSNYKEDFNDQTIPPAGLRTLRFLSESSNHCLILFTASNQDYIANVKKWFLSMNINFNYVNCNPKVESREYMDVSSKFYFDVLLDDKAGFDMGSDWDEVERTLVSIGEWKQE